MMRAPDDILEIFLQPGEFYFGEGKTRVRTLLGSCVAITLWHPRLHLGGMSHYVLPNRQHRKKHDPLDGRSIVGLCEFRTGRCDAANDFGRVTRVEVGIAWIDTLW